MSSKQSAYGRLGIPSPIGETVGLLALALALSPYLAGTDFGFLKVPELAGAAKRDLKVLGPILLAASLLLYFPLWKMRAGGPRSAGTDIAASVVFRNSSNRYICIVWLRFCGKPDPDHSYTLAPGASQVVPTYVAHAWNVTDANTGDLLRSVVIKGEMDPVVIR
jgi:hypothetical protein